MLRSTWAITVKSAEAPESNEEALNSTVPPAPTEGEVVTQPNGAVAETKVVPAGNGNVSEGATAVLGPMFVTFTV